MSEAEITPEISEAYRKTRDRQEDFPQHYLTSYALADALRDQYAARLMAEHECLAGQEDAMGAHNYSGCEDCKRKWTDWQKAADKLLKGE